MYSNNHTMLFTWALDAEVCFSFFFRLTPVRMNIMKDLKAMRELNEMIARRLVYFTPTFVAFLRRSDERKNKH